MNSWRCDLATAAVLALALLLGCQQAGIVLLPALVVLVTIGVLELFRLRGKYRG